MCVAVRGDRVVGFASAGTSHQAEQEKGHEPARDIQLLTIYLLAAEHGTGIGQKLLEGVLGDQPARSGTLPRQINRDGLPFPA
jgi:L-amino acid N-acyltransferase YncA